MLLIFNSKIKERGVSADDSEGFKIRVGLIALVVAKIVAEGGSALIVGVEESEAIDSASN